MQIVRLWNFQVCQFSQRKYHDYYKTDMLLFIDPRETIHLTAFSNERLFRKEEKKLTIIKGIKRQAEWIEKDLQSPQLIIGSDCKRR